MDEPDDNQRVILSEINRELGRFQMAIKYLERPFDKKYQIVVIQIRDHIKRQETKVFQIVH